MKKRGNAVNSKTKTENNKNLVRPMTGNPNMKTNIQNNPLKQNYIKENIQQTDNTKNKNKSTKKKMISIKV